MDGHFVPNISIGIPIVEAVRRITDLPLDVHLMISNPAEYVEAFRKAGADSLTIHVEAANDPRPVLDKIRSLGALAGLALNPPTPLSAIEASLPHCDLVLVMSVMPGFGGQEFDDVAHRQAARAAATRRDCDALLEVDGGVECENDRRVCGSGRRAVRRGDGDFCRTAIIAATIGSHSSQAARLRQTSTIQNVGRKSLGVIAFMVQILVDSPRHDGVRPAGSRAGHARYSAVRRWPAGSRNDGRRAARPADRGHLREPVPVGRANGRGAGAALDLKVKTLDKLQNLDHGLWQGMLVADVKTKQPKVYRQWQEQPETVCPPQGETLVAAKQRVQAALAKLLKKHKSDGVVAIVVPEPLASVIRNVLRHDEWGDLWQCANETAQWQMIDVPETVAAK